MLRNQAKVIEEKQEVLKKYTKLYLKIITRRRIFILTQLLYHLKVYTKDKKNNLSIFQFTLYLQRYNTPYTGVSNYNIFTLPGDDVCFSFLINNR